MMAVRPVMSFFSGPDGPRMGESAACYRRPTNFSVRDCSSYTRILVNTYHFVGLDLAYKTVLCKLNVVCCGGCSSLRAIRTESIYVDDCVRQHRQRSHRHCETVVAL